MSRKCRRIVVDLSQNTLVSVLSFKFVPGRTETFLLITNTQAGIAQTLRKLVIGTCTNRRDGMVFPPPSIFLRDPVSVLQRAKKVLGYQNSLFVVWLRGLQNGTSGQLCNSKLIA